VKKKVMRYFPSKEMLPILHFIHPRRAAARLFELLAGSHKQHICLSCRLSSSSSSFSQSLICLLPAESLEAIML